MKFSMVGYLVKGSPGEMLHLENIKMLMLLISDLFKVNLQAVHVLSHVLMCGTCCALFRSFLKHPRTFQHIIKCSMIVEFPNK